MSELTDTLRTPLFKEIHTYLNSIKLTSDQLMDWDEFQTIQTKLNGGLMHIIYPYVKDKKDLRDKYQHADLSVHIFDTIDGVRLCIKPVVVDLALDLIDEPYTLGESPKYVPLELPFD